MSRKKLWVTYTWDDNKHKDVDFLFNDLAKCVEVRYDRISLVGGQHLWAQIGDRISDPDFCDAFGFVLTPNSIQSRACCEELMIAIDRAMDKRGRQFPIIGLVKDLEHKDLPPVIRTRLYYRIDDPRLPELVAAAVEGRAVNPPTTEVPPFEVTFHQPVNGVKWLEIRPRRQRLSSLIVFVDAEEESAIGSIETGVPGSPPRGTRSVSIAYEHGERRVSNYPTSVHRWRLLRPVGPDTSTYVELRDNISWISIGPDEPEAEFTIFQSDRARAKQYRLA